MKSMLITQLLTGLLLVTPASADALIIIVCATPQMEQHHARVALNPDIMKPTVRTIRRFK